MYETIYVPVDNSDYSNRAVQTSLRLGSAFRSKLVGCHVYAARMHDYRFKQMEFTLPEEYLEENELHRQRKIHDSLISMGLELISDCYLSDMGQLAQAAGLEFEPKMMDGKHSTELVKDVAASGYDLVVLGALGIGRTRDSQIGSVCQRVSREVDRDVWVVKHLPEKGEAERDTIMVGVDGSPQSFGALMTAIDLARQLDKKLELVSVYDPYLHYAVFKGIVEVLTDKAAKVFRFEEQNQLHEEIIDTGLAEIYQSHLNVAEKMARDEGVEVTKTLLDGKVFQKVLDHARKVEPYLLVIGRVGVHTTDEDGELLGSNTDNLLRLAPCDVLLTNRAVTPELDVKAEESIHWTPEAEERMTRVPEQVVGIARTAILRLAIEQGHSVVTSDLVTEAMERFMPKASQAATTRLAEALAFDKARREAVSVCTRCSHVALVPDPAKCSSCGGTEFEVVTPEMIDKIAAAEGGTEEETTYDGRKLRWSQEARKALRTLGDNYQRRRAKARIEKSARSNRLDTITLDFAKRFVEEETGVLYRPAEGDEGMSAADKLRAAEEAVRREAAEAAAPPADDDAELKMLARDRKGNPLLSRRDWTEKAIERVLRVPSGFMRDRTQRRIEELAEERGETRIDLELVEEGIKIGLQLMEEMIQTYGGASPEMKAEDATESGNGKTENASADADAQTADADCPVDHAEEAAATEEPAAEATATEEAGSDGAGRRAALNEVSVLTEMEKQRQELSGR